MKKQSLQILHRYRKHLLEREQILLQDRIAEENQQKARLLQLQARVQETHEAKSKATTVEELCALDEAAAYLHGRMTLARRAISVCGQARENALQKTLQTKQGRDQVEALLENERREHIRANDEAEKRQIDELVTSRYAITSRGL
jgi:flagellar export protein FliJ